MGFDVTYADLSVDPPLLSNADVRYDRARFAGSHVALSAGGNVTLRRHTGRLLRSPCRPPTSSGRPLVTPLTGLTKVTAASGPGS